VDAGNETQEGFGTGLRAALARAEAQRAPDDPPAPASPRDVVSPELALVARDATVEPTSVTAAPAGLPANANRA
jgi:hypothetical protein